MGGQERRSGTSARALVLWVQPPPEPAPTGTSVEVLSFIFRTLLHPFPQDKGLVLTLPPGPPLGPSLSLSVCPSGHAAPSPLNNLSPGRQGLCVQYGAQAGADGYLVADSTALAGGQVPVELPPTPLTATATTLSRHPLILFLPQLTSGQNWAETTIP